jgi:hypothetical protein
MGETKTRIDGIRSAQFGNSYFYNSSSLLSYSQFVSVIV